MGPPDTRLWRDRIAPEGELPSDRQPDRTKRAIALEAVKVWPGKTEHAGESSATANLESFCARRHGPNADRDEETAFRSNKETDQKGRCTVRPTLLDKTFPIQGVIRRDRD